MSHPVLSRAGSLLSLSSISTPKSPMSHQTLRKVYQTRSRILPRLQAANFTSSPTTTSSFRQSLRRPLKQSHRQSSSSSSTYTPPPGPILTRDPDRPLPNPPSSTRVWARTLPLFGLAVVISALAIFNYQKSTSSTVSSILYSLRRSPIARDVLGDEVYFASSVPWIRGTMNQLHGKIDIVFWVKGTKGEGKTRFWAERRGGRGGVFETMEWSLTLEDGQVIQLLNDDSPMPVA